MVTPKQIEQWLLEGLPESKVTVAGDGRHFEAKIISSLFMDKSSLARHRMVFSILGDKMDSKIHALSLKTLTPNEANRE